MYEGMTEVKSNTGRCYSLKYDYRQLRLEEKKVKESKTVSVH